MKIDLKSVFVKFFKLVMQDKKIFLTIAIGVFGILLVAFSGGEDTDRKTVCGHTSFSEFDVKTELEDFISMISGAGKVKVMITYESSEEEVFAKDHETKEKESDNTKKEEYIVLDSGNIESGLKLKSIYPKVKGVAVVCQGASDYVIKEQIVSVVSALFNISANCISVVNMK